MRLNIYTLLLACLVTLLGIPAINIATAQDVTPKKYEIYDYTEPRIGTTPDQSALSLWFRAL
ncbi:MAG: hypothetical protein J6Q95_01940 [Alistipes sp.]|nr:hypothetical protein [Alistipes sp.]